MSFSDIPGFVYFLIGFFILAYTVSLYFKNDVLERENKKLKDKDNTLSTSLKMGEGETKNKLQAQELLFKDKLREIELMHQSKIRESDLAYQNKVKENNLANQKKMEENFIRVDEHFKNKLQEYKEKELKELTQLLLQKWKIEEEAAIREDAIKRSSAVSLGRITEQFIPFMNRFPYNTRDVRFIGSPIDLIIFDGHTEGKDRIDIVFVEVKTSTSQLSAPQKRIKEAILLGRVKWWETKGDNFTEKPNLFS